MTTTHITDMDDEVFSLELDLEALNEVRKFISITMTKLESKMQSLTPDTRIHTETARSYRALKRVYNETMAAIEEAAGL